MSRLQLDAERGQTRALHLSMPKYSRDQGALCTL